MERLVSHWRAVSARYTHCLHRFFVGLRDKRADALYQLSFQVFAVRGFVNLYRAYARAFGYSMAV
ncbi:MAG TPA: hypothetical protein VJS44_08420 [Pyrinomonadaceae bacterium]|nr:hypothetical protein [Pyrinomonadaceae bacterium]